MMATGESVSGVPCRFGHLSGAQTGFSRKRPDHAHLWKRPRRSPRGIKTKREHVNHAILRPFSSMSTLQIYRPGGPVDVGHKVETPEKS